MALRLGLGLGAGGGRSPMDSDAMSFISRAGIAGGTVVIPVYSSKNILVWSEDFTKTTWSKIGTASVTGDQTTDPNAGNTADLLSGATDLNWSTGNMTYANFFNASPSTTYTASVYVKAGTATTFGIRLRDGSTGTSPSTTITPNQNWQRVSVSLTTGASTTGFALVLGGANGTVFVWGAQVEIGNTATSYVSTTDIPPLGISGTIAVNPRQQIIDFVKGLKTLGIWNNTVCWPMRNFQNTNTGGAGSVKSLGGLGTFDGTITNGPTWGQAGIQSGATSSRVAIPVTIAPYIANGASIFGAVLNANDDNYDLFRINNPNSIPTYPAITLNFATTQGINAMVSRNGTRYDQVTCGGVFASGISTVSAVIRTTSQANFRNGTIISNETGLNTLNPSALAAPTVGTIAGKGNGSSLRFGGTICPISLVSSSILTDTQVADLNGLYKTTLGVGLNIP